MLPSKDNETCKKCGLWKGCKTPFMDLFWKGRISFKNITHPKLLICGEAPGENEDSEGIPFIGKSGQLLRNVLGEVGFDVENDVAFTNIVRCRPPENKITARHINYCKQFAVQDIEQYKPEMIFLLGNSPLSGILGESGISNWNGVVVEKDLGYGIIKIVPLFHPAYILRDTSNMDAWIEAMLKAVDPEEEVAEGYELLYPKTFEEIIEMQNWLETQPWISFDTEVSALDAYSDVAMVLAVSFAGEGRAYSIAVDHPDVECIGDYIVDVIINILESHNKRIIGHNIKFDLMHIKAVWYADVDAGGDTMLVSHLLDSRPGNHGLKRLAGMYLGMYEYDEELKDYVKIHKEADVHRGGSYAFVPLSILLPYSAKDAEATYRLHQILYPKLSAKQKILYKQMIMPVSDTLTRVQCNGIAVDYYIAERYRSIYDWRQKCIYDSIVKDKHVRKMVDAAVDSNKKDWKFNPNSSQQLAELLFERYKIKTDVKTPTGKFSTSNDVLRPFEAKYPIVKDLRYYKLLSKMLGTYLEPCANKEWSSGDGRVRTTYNLHGTVTGRLSSSQPVNLQNIPTPEKEPGTLLETLPIKNIFTHSYWNGTKQSGVIMSVDYSGMELRVFASMSKCQPMIDIHVSGKDFHSCVAIMSMTHKHPDDITFEEIKALDKATRYVYKWTNWTLLYGGDEYTLVNLYDVPVDEARQTVHMYYDMFPEVLDYKTLCTEFAQDHGYIESPFGRREKLSFINDRDGAKRNGDIRSAVNMPIQSGASDTLLCALEIIDTILHINHYKTKIVNTVHDSIVLDVPNKEINDVAVLCKDVMENVKDYASEHMPKIDFSWLICPLKADIEIGSHYGAEEEYTIT